MKKLYYILLVFILFSHSCASKYWYPYKHNYELNGYLIWTTFKLFPKPGDNLNYNSQFVLFFIDKKYIDYRWIDYEGYVFKLKKETIPIIVLQHSVYGEFECSSNYFWNLPKIGKKFNYFYEDSLNQTRMIQGTFLIKKNQNWNKYNWNYSLRDYYRYKNDVLREKKEYKITLDGKDTIKVCPIWGFNFIETLIKKESLITDKKKKKKKKKKKNEVD